MLRSTLEWAQAPSLHLDLQPFGVQNSEVEARVLRAEGEAVIT